ncbi:MAG: hypothetical protein ACRENO_04455 [Thermodesulfobacteriota bacterium]
MTNKKKVLGIDPLSWIKQTKDSFEEKNFVDKLDEHVPKFETYEVKLTLRLAEEHLNFLSGLEREIMKNRSSKNKKERITKNSIVRAMLENLKYINFDKKEIPDEKELQNRLKKTIKGGLI